LPGARCVACSWPGAARCMPRSSGGTCWLWRQAGCATGSWRPPSPAGGTWPPMPRWELLLLSVMPLRTWRALQRACLVCRSARCDLCCTYVHMHHSWLVLLILCSCGHACILACSVHGRLDMAAIMPLRDAGSWSGSPSRCTLPHRPPHHLALLQDLHQRLRGAVGRLMNKQLGAAFSRWSENVQEAQVGTWAHRMWLAMRWHLEVLTAACCQRAWRLYQHSYHCTLSIGNWQNPASRCNTAGTA
jgi:hypothetical protein